MTDTLTFQENSFGIVKRMQVISTHVQTVVNRRGGRASVADIGCGTGQLLTLPLARRFVDSVTVTAYDPDTASLATLTATAARWGLTNVTPVSVASALTRERYDVVVASEVLEHADRPFELMTLLRSLTKDGGVLILTVPNGFGYFEIEAIVFNLLRATSIASVMRQAASCLWRRDGHGLVSDQDASLAISPHVNFFTVHDVRALCEQTGFQIVEFTGRCFLSGHLIDLFVRHLPAEPLIRANCRWGSTLPLRLASGWIVVAAPFRPPASRWAPPHHPVGYDLWQRVKRAINIRAGHRQEARSNRGQQPCAE